MNLTIEYLVRTGVIKRFFKPPQSLFLQGNDQRLIVTIQEDQNRPNFYHIIHWDMLVLDKDFPKQSHFYIDKNELFSHESVIVPNYLPIPYDGQSIETEYNDYNHPMSYGLFDGFSRAFLNSESHQKSKLIWLWECFSDHFFNDWFLFPESIDIRYQLSLIQCDYPSIWEIWRKWKGVMILDEKAATELIFFSTYASFSSF